MKIALFTDTFTPQINGVAKTLNHLTKYFDRKQISYTVFAPLNVKDENKSNHVQKLKSIPFAVYPECRLAVPNLHLVKKTLLHFQPDLIHVATPFTMGLLGKYYARKLKIPLVGSYHTDFDAYLIYYKMEFLSPLLWNYLRWFHNSLQKTFVPSHETLQQLQKKHFEHLSIWSRGVDCTLFRPDCYSGTIRNKYSITAKHLLCFAGRLAPEKDIDTLQSIIDIVNTKIGNQVQWLIAGDGPLAKDLKSRAAKNVLFTGYLTPDELAAVYAASDLMVFPSSTETFGNVVLESMACGTPVIGANAGGVKNIITDDQNGKLCTPKSACEFADALIPLLEDPVTRHKMSQCAIEHARSQSWDHIFAQLLSEYAELFEHRSANLLRVGKSNMMND
ncbi:glycosyltransferase family 1 protein [Sporolactobacillus shoreicorticis]|uniref:Glycosyltransferase family 4 protein n=1 Tax=Sporolactobacillus shoreicorticis TaxID=1923877 RepID=A0ABW5S0F2_9BACL|nr:glycosyltransferase family 1 protein [Sporolactobacillus shoreicorticis]MCO7126982.1 glycosyltransferase family 1 protein [Sporolactobacillus shoreicorticis]